VSAPATARVAEILLRIVERRRERLAEAPPASVAATRARPLEPGENRFLEALAERPAGRGAAVVAEVKMGSPRLGSLAGRFDPLAQARAYAAAGAAALSVVVEPDFFFGSYDLLAACRRASGLPALAKDFVVDRRQLVWAKEAGADAVLLVAALYERDELAAYARLARGLGLVPLVETHDPEDLDLLGGAGGTGGEGWELVGVNRRDLRTFAVDHGHAEAMAPRLPAGAVKVAESGIASGADVARLAAAGYDAFLVGEALLTAPDPAARLAELVRAGK
jgi:indole-3-glycerol phosphate synthase